MGCINPKPWQSPKPIINIKWYLKVLRRLILKTIVKLYPTRVIPISHSIKQLGILNFKIKKAVKDKACPMVNADICNKIDCIFCVFKTNNIKILK